jgi:GDPmannose 4,6-dehydratase
MVALIFGITGQDGFYLKRLLVQNGFSVIGISRTVGDYIGDVSDKQLVYKLVGKYEPEFIFNFAAVSSTSHNCLYENHNTISLGAINIFEAVRELNTDSKIFISGSALQFKNDSLPISETNEFVANSPYAAERNYCVYLSRYYREKFSLKIYIGYFFNHDSSLRTLNHVNKKITSFVNSCSKGDTLNIGDYSIKKEFNFAGDFMQAIWILVNQEQVFEAIIGSGKSYSILDWIKICFEMKNLDYNDFIVLEKSFMPEYTNLQSDPKLIFSLGWKPHTSISELAHIMINDIV